MSRALTFNDASLDYVRSHYGLQVRAGQRVRLSDGKAGVVVSGSNHVHVVLDGQKHDVPYHPSDVVEVLGEPAVEAKGQGGTCKSCGKVIVWVTMRPSGKLAPIDADSIRQLVVLNGDQTEGAVRYTGVNHFATCPSAGEHRQKVPPHKRGDIPADGPAPAEPSPVQEAAAQDADDTRNEANDWESDRKPFLEAVSRLVNYDVLCEWLEAHHKNRPPLLTSTQRVNLLAWLETKKGQDSIRKWLDGETRAGRRRAS